MSDFKAFGALELKSEKICDAFVFGRYIDALRLLDELKTLTDNAIRIVKTKIGAEDD